MGWEQLISIIEEGKEEMEREIVRREHVCPFDGTPLLTGPNGVRYCRFDGRIDHIV